MTRAAKNRPETETGTAENSAATLPTVIPAGTGGAGSSNRPLEVVSTEANIYFRILEAFQSLDRLGNAVAAYPPGRPLPDTALVKGTARLFTRISLISVIRLLSLISGGLKHKVSETLVEEESGDVHLRKIHSFTISGFGEFRFSENADGGESRSVFKVQRGAREAEIAAIKEAISSESERSDSACPFTGSASQEEDVILGKKLVYDKLMECRAELRAMGGIPEAIEALGVFIDDVKKAYQGK